jgi:hypothetical protein
MRRRPWSELLLLTSTLLGGTAAVSQYNPPATPAPYNPIALAEVTGAARAAVQAGQNNYQTLSQNPYLGGVPGEDSVQRQWRFLWKTRSPLV